MKDIFVFFCLKGEPLESLVGFEKLFITNSEDFSSRNRSRYSFQGMEK